jgi:hypothetical protein
MARLHRRYKKRRSRRTTADPAPRRNPPLFSDLAEWVGPGFASFALTRFTTRVAATQIAAKKPSWGRHVGAGVSIGAFLAAWFLAHRVKWLAKYHTPITVGAAIAALQSLIQLYIPKLGWMVSDASPELAAADVSASQLAAPQLIPVNEDPNEYTYNDTFDAGRFSKTGMPVKGNSGQTPPIIAQHPEDDLSDLQIDEAIGQSQNLGVFSGN